MDNKNDHSKIDHSKMNHSETDHSKMDHSKMDHSKMDHSKMNHGEMDHSMHGGNFKSKFFISLVLAVPIVLLSPMMGKTLPFQFTFNGSEWVVLILATILYFYGGMPFLKGAVMEVKRKSPGMMMLISLGITVSYVYSVYTFIANNFLNNETMVMDFFWELATLIVIMLLGHWIEMNAVSNAGNALQRMAELLPGTASIVDEKGKITEVDLKAVNIGDYLLVKPGEKVPTDGEILEGKTTVNESMVTGESKAVEKNIGEKVIGGSVNGSGTIKIKVTGTGESGYLSQVMNLVSTAQKEKSRVELLSDIVAKWLFYIAVGVGVIAFIVWLIVEKDLNIALERMVTVLIIACPHALGLAIPLVTARSTSIGAKNGLLIKNRQALEIAKNVDVIMMDKTGTLTEGNFAVAEVKSFNNKYNDNDVLELMGALEQSSSHPLAVGILNKIKDLNLQIPLAKSVNNIPGIGIGGIVKDQEMKIVSVKYLKTNNISYDENHYLELTSIGNSVSFLIINDENIGLVAQGDKIKPEAKSMIEEMIRNGIKPVMLTGDNKQAAEVVAKHLGIKDVHSELLPDDKERIIKEYKDKGLTVMMVGDGVNDAPSLVRADIGVAIGAGTDVAIDSADVILVKSNPSDILHFFKLSKRTTTKMKQNLWWGAGYNIVAIPLAAGILAPIGLILTPAIGAILMSLSTIIVAINAMMLKID